MRTLYIAFIPPGDDSGGGIVCKQSILSLQGSGPIDYIGPEILDEEVQGCVGGKHYLVFDNNLFWFGMQLFRGITTGYFKSWQTVQKKIDWDLYDLVFLESTVFHFVAGEARRHKKKIVIRLHNVEQDYYKNLLRIHLGIKWRIRLFFSRYQEGKTLAEADGVICLTENDQNRIVALYPEETTNCQMTIVPVAIRNLVSETIFNPYCLLMTGSLWYGPNEEGIVWFIRNVWEPLWENRDAYPWIERYQLVIAGSRPTQKLVAALAQVEGVRLIESPEDMKPLFRKAGLFVAPVFSGAGMKVKVAEAFSFGLPVIGTSHAFIGYRMLNGEWGYVANDAHEFMEALYAYHELSADAKGTMRKKVKHHFQTYYEIGASRTSFHKFIKGL